MIQKVKSYQPSTESGTINFISFINFIKIIILSLFDYNAKIQHELTAAGIIYTYSLQIIMT